MVKYWKRYPGESMESSSLQKLKAQLDVALSNLLYLTLLSAARSD